jgi:hypothetical protein
MNASFAESLRAVSLADILSSTEIGIRALRMKPKGFLLTIAQALLYIPGGAWSLWKFIGLLL